MRIASLIFRSLSAQPFDTVILCSSDCLGLLGVGCKTTCVRGETINFPAFLQVTLESLQDHDVRCVQHFEIMTDLLQGLYLNLSYNSY